MSERVLHPTDFSKASAAAFALIIIGTHGRTGMAQLFLASIAARVAATAPCPVLTVRGC
jgi:nucleotide-binding universal stress UspA family protein